jgi:hypothetical protein
MGMVLIEHKVEFSALIAGKQMGDAGGINRSLKDQTSFDRLTSATRPAQTPMSFDPR